MRSSLRTKRLEGVNAADDTRPSRSTKPPPVERSQIRLSEVRRWRAACRGLALTFDRALADHLNRLAGVRPW